MISKIVYILCALTSISCAILLLRGFFQSKSRLLLWSGLCFVCLGLSNTVLFVDLVVLPPEIDLSPYRMGLTLLGLAILVFGMIWETT